MKITVVVTGDKAVRAKLKRLGSSLRDNKKAFDEISKQAIDYFQTRGFSSQGGVFGEKWQPLSSAYQRQKSRRYRGKSTLVATGKMQDSFYAETGKTYALIQNRAPYFKFHQSTAPRTKMPRRATMGVNEPIKRIVRNALKAEMSRKLRAS